MKNRHSGSRIFLTELLFSIFYFVIVAAVCVQCIAQSYVLSNSAKETGEAINVVSNAAEEFYADKQFRSFTDYYSKDWNKMTGADEAYYKVTGIVNSENGNYSLIDTMSVTVSRTINDTEVYSLKVKKSGWIGGLTKWVS